MVKERRLFSEYENLLLIVNEIHKNKIIFLISDLFYFLGTCLVPLSLI